MFAHDLHVLLTWATVVAMAALAPHAGVRVVRGREPGHIAEVGVGLALILIGMTAAAGLAMLARGERPREWLHLIYALVVFGLVPATDALTEHAPPRTKALARLAGAVVALAVIARLAATG
jgi:hypothetical protein